MYSSDESSDEGRLLLSKFMSCPREEDQRSSSQGVKYGRTAGHGTSKRMVSNTLKTAHDARGLSPLQSNLRHSPRSDSLSSRPSMSSSSASDSPSVDTDTLKIIVPPPGSTAERPQLELEVPRRTPSTTRVTQRPRRLNAAPANYYAKSAYSGYASGSDGEKDRKFASAAADRPPSEPQYLPIQRPHKQLRIIYASCNLRICRRPFHSLDDIPLLGHVPYSPEDEPSRYAERSSSGLVRRILHVTFDHNEMKAVLDFLPYQGTHADWSELSPSDQVIQAVRSMSKLEFERFLKRTTQIIHLNNLLAENGIDNFEEYCRAQTKPKWIESRIWRRMERLAVALFQSDIEDEKFIMASPRYLTMASALGRRKDVDIESFLLDARNGNLSTTPYVIESIPCDDLETYNRIGAGDNTISSILRDREQGVKSRRSQRHLCNDGLKLWRSWKGASNDVLNLTWSPDGIRFAVGAAAQCDEHNMQYNRRNNLLIGDLLHNTIRELPDHRIYRPSTSSTSDPFLYMSVSAVQWAEDKLYTASYDKTVKVWDISTHSSAACIHTLKHESKVQVMARSDFEVNLLASGTDSVVGLWKIGEDMEYLHLNLARPRFNKNVDLMPSSLAWGSTAKTKDLLVTGMSSTESQYDDTCKEGYLAMWKLSESSAEPIHLQPSAQNVFDVKWHPYLPLLATANSVPALRASGTAKDVRSAVRIYEPLTTRSRILELDCPALDINDVTFCPVDTTYISASCTDGITYVWDFRNPSVILHKLPHGEPLNQMDERLAREQADVGVRVASWGSSIDRLYTGGSDGILKSWNILLSTEDVHVGDVASIEDEIMCGVFSPDKTNLLVGDASGGIHLLSSGPFSDAEYCHLDFEPANESDSAGVANPQAKLDPDSAIGSAERWLSSGQLIRHSIYGVGKGPCYDGPYAAWARPSGISSDMLAVTPLIEDIAAMQLDGPPVDCRIALDDTSKSAVRAQIQLARIRNLQPNGRKRKRRRYSHEKMPGAIIINLCSDEETDSTTRVKVPIATSTTATTGTEIIDLTGDSDAEDAAPVQILSGLAVSSDKVNQKEQSLEDKLVDDYWWPESHSIDPNIHDFDL